MLAKTLGSLADVARDATGWLWLYALAANVLLLAAPIYMIQIYGQILPGQGMETLLYLTGIVLAALALYGLVESVRSVIAQKLSARYDLAASEAFLRMRHDPAGDDPAEILRDIAAVRQVIAGRVLMALCDLPFAPLFVVILFVAHPILGLIALGGAGLLVALAVLNSRSVGGNSETLTGHLQRSGRFASAALRQDEDIRAMGMAPQMLTRWKRAALLASATADQTGTTNAVYFGLTRFVRQALQILMLGVGAYLVLVGQMSVGLIFAASLLSGRALQPIEQMIGGWPSLVQGHAAHKRVLAALGDSLSHSEPIELPGPEGRLTAEQAGFAIARGAVPTTVLEPVDLSVTPGEIVAVMGPSGAGKSTLARLLAGVSAPTAGAIRLDGVALDQWNEVQRGAAIGYIGQGASVPDGTVAEIIARFRPDVADAEIVGAAQRARAHEFIARLPEGYGTVVGRGGLRLSGGQAQRLLLARSLFGRPKVLVLDEPNAFLDAEGEQALIEALSAARREGAAIVVVSQRSSVLAVADRVAIIRAGRLESCGPVQRPQPGDAQQSGRRMHVASFRRTNAAAGTQ